MIERCSFNLLLVASFIPQNIMSCYLAGICTGCIFKRPSGYNFNNKVHSWGGGGGNDWQPEQD